MTGSGPMSRYSVFLTDVFPFQVEGPRDTVIYWVDTLNGNDKLPNGTSYAVTADAPEGRVNLWLSQESMAVLSEHGLLSGDPAYCRHSRAYYCPTSGKNECPTCGGFNICCDQPRLHGPVREDLVH